MKGTIILMGIPAKHRSSPKIVLKIGQQKIRPGRIAAGELCLEDNAHTTPQRTTPTLRLLPSLLAATEVGY
jgi:hypothetical protein